MKIIGIPAEVTLEELLKATRETTRGFYKQHPKNMLQPMIVGFLPNGNTVTLLGDFDSSEERELFAMGAGLTMKSKGVVAYSFVSEAWSAVQPVTSKDRRLPSERDDRVEVVMTCCSDKKRDLCAVDKIIRDPVTGQVSDLEPLETFAPDAYNRFGGLLR